MIDVVGIDAPCMDFLVNLEELPYTNCSMPILQSSWQGGGKAATALVALARLGGSCGKWKVFKQMRYVIGADCGSTKCLIKAKDFEGNLLATSMGKTTNHLLIGLNEAKRRIVSE